MSDNNSPFIKYIMSGGNDVFDPFDLEKNGILKFNANYGASEKDIYLAVSNKIGSFSRELMQEVIDIVQLWCPVDTGFLKSTGYLTQTADGYEVVYDAYYAGYVAANNNWVMQAFTYVFQKRMLIGAGAKFVCDDFRGSIKLV